MAEQTLASSPSIVTSFARSLQPIRPGAGRPATLPDRRLRLDGRRTDLTRLAGYQRLCGFAVSDVLPPTYVHVQAFPLAVALMADPAFPLPLLGLVHVRNSMTQYRPVRAAEPLTLRVHAENLRDHPAGRQVDLCAQAHVEPTGDGSDDGTSDGELVWAGTSTYLHRSPTAEGGERERPSTATVPAVPTSVWRLPADVGRRYAQVSGDRNPIHLSALTARAFGFPRAIAHGMYLHARALAAVSTRLADSFTVDAAFKTPAFLPSTVVFVSTPVATGWQLSISESRSGKPHFEATVH